tara:strand:- start:1866 stop:2297 length:432 start_codon:yes stop_codon:yes gene_type:complete
LEHTDSSTEKVTPETKVVRKVNESFVAFRDAVCGGSLVPTPTFNDTWDRLVCAMKKDGYLVSIESNLESHSTEDTSTDARITEVFRVAVKEDAVSLSSFLSSLEGWYSVSLPCSLGFMVAVTNLPSWDKDLLKSKLMEFSSGS